MVGLTSPTHIVLLLLIALLLFGAKRLPEIGRSLGHGMREFKDSVSDLGEHETHVTRVTLPPVDETEPMHTTVGEHEIVREREII
jgi:sec-independent protein translocase protein TatA